MSSIPLNDKITMFFPLWNKNQEGESSSHQEVCHVLITVHDAESTLPRRRSPPGLRAKCVVNWPMLRLRPLGDAKRRETDKKLVNEPIGWSAWALCDEFRWDRN